MSENAIHHLGYYYDPPSWQVCDHRASNGDYYRTTNNICPRCANSPRPGYLPIHYRPQQWKAAGGILDDDTLVWLRYIHRDPKWTLHRYGDTVFDDYVIIATSAGRPANH